MRASTSPRRLAAGRGGGLNRARDQRRLQQPRDRRHLHAKQEDCAALDQNRRLTYAGSDLILVWRQSQVDLASLYRCEDRIGR
jgi:hypothetical protein